MKSIVKIIIVCVAAILVPDIATAQGDGGKKKKKAQSTQTVAKKKPRSGTTRSTSIKNSRKNSSPDRFDNPPKNKRENDSRETQPEAKPVNPIKEADTQSSNIESDDFGSQHVIAEPVQKPETTIFSIPSVPKSGFENNHKWMDLGLPSGTKWATCNIGANNPEESGSYFAWGEINPKSIYTIDNSKTFKKVIEIQSDINYDVASVKWGGNWKIPTKQQCDELNSVCTWLLGWQGGMYGYTVTGPNGNSIFLPASGYYRDKTLYNAMEGGYYWCSNDYAPDDKHARSLWFFNGKHNTGWHPRWLGFTIRPVIE